MSKNQTTPQEDIARSKAIKRVEELKDFYQHVQSYLGVCFVLVLINLFTSGRISWARYVIFFWGIGLLFHAASTYWCQFGLWGGDWEDKKIEELTEKFTKNK